MAESRASAGLLVLSGVVVGGLFEQVHGVVVEAALGVAHGALNLSRETPQSPLEADVVTNDCLSPSSP